MYEITKVAAIAAVSCVALYATAKRESRVDTLVFYLVSMAILIWGC